MNKGSRRPWRRALRACLAGLLVSACASSVPPGDLATALRSELDAAKRVYGFPGATAAVVEAGGDTCAVATGLADLESGAPMRPDSRMLAASIGKTFVSATVLSLAADGELAIDDPLAAWLGDRAWYLRLPNASGITLRHLLEHTAGLPDHVHDPDFRRAFGERWRETEPPGPADLVAFILDEPPLFPPGARFSYSDTGYILLGMVVEAASGERYYDLVEQRFLRPLGLTHTAPADRRELPGLAAGYTATPNPFGLPPKTTVAPGILAWQPGIEWTGGGLVSNSRDLAVWGHALFGGDVLADADLRKMLEPGPPQEENTGNRYAAGVAISNSPNGRTYGHRGWIPGYVSSLLYYPDHGVSVAVQINADTVPSGDIAQVLGELEDRLAAVAIRAAATR